jgi:hypothetical protein
MMEIDAVCSNRIPVAGGADFILGWGDHLTLDQN